MIKQELVIEDITEEDEYLSPAEYQEEDMLNLAKLFKRKRKTILGIPSECYWYGAIITSFCAFSYFLYQNGNKNQKQNK